MLEKYSLDANQIHIWVIPLNQFHHQLASVLSDEEIMRANRFYFDHHRQHFIIAHHAMRFILSQYLKVDAKLISYDTNEFGKPHLVGHKLAFNLSHSHQYALLACAQSGLLGVDIEYIQDGYKENIAKRFFTEDENAELEALDWCTKREAFYDIWSRKEAILKAEGKGLHLPLKSFSVRYQGYQTISVCKNTYYLASLNLLSDYKIAVASNLPLEQIFIWRYT